MKIIKFTKLNNDCYKILFENKSSITLYEDIILKYNLLVTKKIDDIEGILLENKKYDIYSDSIKYLKHKLRTIMELKKYLYSHNYSNDNIESIIERLKKEKYLNDELYSKTYISERISLSNDGPYKIIKDLDKKGVMEEDYLKYLNDFNKELIAEKIKKIINKMLKSNHQSKYLLRNKIINHLSNLGYDMEDISSNLDCLDSMNDAINYEFEKNKLRKRLAKKYQGLELEMVLKQKLYQKGYRL